MIASRPEQSHHGHLAILLVSSEGFGGLLANSNLFQRIQTWGNALLNSRSQDCDSSSVTSSQISDIKRTIP